MTSVRIRPAWRAAAFAALIAFLWLPRGHLQGHEQVATARAHHTGSAAAFVPPAPDSGGSERAGGCPLCLSLSKVRSTLAVLTGAESSAPTSASPLAATRPVHVREAYVSAHTAPRAPPSA